MGDLDDLDFEIEEPTVRNAQEYSNLQLVDEYHSVIEELYQLREAIAPKTQHGRDLHSWRTSLLIEMATRGLR